MRTISPCWRASASRSDWVTAVPLQERRRGARRHSEIGEIETDDRRPPGVRWATGRALRATPGSPGRCCGAAAGEPSRHQRPPLPSVRELLRVGCGQEEIQNDGFPGQNRTSADGTGQRRCHLIEVCAGEAVRCHRRERRSSQWRQTSRRHSSAVSSSTTTRRQQDRRAGGARKTTTGSPVPRSPTTVPMWSPPPGPRSRASGRRIVDGSRNHGPAGPDGESADGAAHRVGHLGDEIGRGVVAPRCAGSLTVTDLGARSVIAASQLRHAPVVTSSSADGARRRRPRSRRAAPAVTTASTPSSSRR